MTTPEVILNWRKSGHSGNESNCVEVAATIATGPNEMDVALNDRS